jgi:CarD family transcriptional regulator
MALRRILNMIVERGTSGMYQAGATVLYGMHGVCEISGVDEKIVNGRSTDYYVLHPIFDEKTTIFLPVNKEGAVEKMRPVLSPDEIRKLIHAMPGETAFWIENANERKLRYREILAEGDRVAIVRMIKALYLQRQKRLALGKKPLASDAEFMRAGEKILYDEFAHVLKIKRERVLPFIMEQISPEERR